MRDAARPSKFRENLKNPSILWVRTVYKNTSGMELKERKAAN
jgi:hypothetical protein